MKKIKIIVWSLTACIFLFDFMILYIFDASWGALVFFLAVIFIFAFFQMAIIKVIDELNENRIRRTTIDIYKNQYTTAMNYHREFKHKIKNIINLIMLTDLTEKDIESLLSKKKSNEFTKGIHINPIFEMILFNIATKCKDKGIDITFDLRGDIDVKNSREVKEHEIIEILTNICTNAFEASLRTYEETGVAKINIMLNFSENYQFEVSNKYNQISKKELNSFTKRNYSTKKEKGHGIGLHSVSHIINKYNGYLSISYVDDSIKIIITI